MVNELRKVFATGKTRDIEWRKRQLRQIVKMVEERHEEMTSAVRADLGGPKIRGLGELGCLKAADFALQHLDKWVKPEVVTTPLEVSPSMMGKSTVRKEPKGVVLIISPWNYPIELAMHPIVSAIAAGNCIVIKPSEVSSNSAKCIEALVNKYLDTECIKVVQGAVAETTALLRLQWDHIFYTGNGSVGRIVMEAAAKHLTPVTLELGGKSPVIIDESARLDVAVGRIGLGKWFNCGQTCVAPDYVLVHEKLHDKFVQELAAQTAKMYPDAKKSPDWGRIINSRHVERIKKLMQDTKGKFVCGDIKDVDPSERYIPPTVIDGVSKDEPLLKEEIFGPVLPIMSYKTINEAIDTVNKVCESPLALYVFSENKRAINEVMDRTSSGGACINSCMEHLTNVHLPFGGIGASGFGAYHGKFGFDEFSHRRGVLHQDSTLLRKPLIPLPPYKDSMYDTLLKISYTGFMSKKTKRILKVVALGVILAAVGRVVQQMQLV
eukprot:Sspe_Gene.74500::Locus_46269_Transcript_1_1_Confidence_1.000_Length_1805::g.74500::m.74500/K00128/ALDH; aldehyde dehydrogenase (NAD+)